MDSLRLFERSGAERRTLGCSLEVSGFLLQRYLCHEAQGVPLVGDGAVGGSNSGPRRGRRGHLADGF
jgi:hypothetical protein